MPWSDAENETLKRLYPTAPWAKLFAALPRRTRVAIANRASNRFGLHRTCSPRHEWTEFEVRRLRDTYPRASEEELAAAFPNRTRSGIASKAKSLGVRRLHPCSRTNDRFIQPILVELRRERERRRITRRALAKQIGYHVNNVLAWEIGRASTTLDRVIDLAAALGFDVVLRPRAPDVSALDEPIPWPERRQLMARR